MYIYIHNKISFGHKKNEVLANATLINIDDMQSKVNPTQKDKYCTAPII